MSANEVQIGGSHYRSTFQHWDLIALHDLSYIVGCATKYLTRWRKKAGLQDLQKSRHYVKKLMDLLEEHGIGPVGHVPLADVAEFCVVNNIEALESAAIIKLCTWKTLGDLEEVEALIDKLIEDNSDFVVDR